jgi:hypothetical protein
VRAVYALGTFTVGTAADLTHVLSVVGTDTTDTLLLGAYLPVGGTLALTADLAPVTLVPGATLALDGAGHTLDAQSHAALDIISGQLSLSDLTLAGAWGVHVGTAATLDIGLATDFADGGIVLDGDHVTLSVAAGAHPATTIYGLSDHDVFLAEGITNGSARYDQQAGRLTIAGNGGTLVLPIESTNPISGSFLVSQTLAGTRVTYIACYVAGTLIATPLGEQPIETLRIGDLVHTSTNGPCPIRWIGWQRYEKSEIRKNPLFRPVRIRAGALSPGVPRRDLLVSATHGIFLDGALVIAGALVNGTTILRDPPGAVTYLHLALHSHELLLAEHTLAESYVDLGGSNLFTHPPRIALPKPAFTRLDHHPHAPPNPGKGRLRGHIEQVADGTVAGWALDDGGPRLALELLAFPHAPIPILANRYRGDLDDAGLAEGVCGFSQKLPPGLKEVLVRRQIDGMALPNSAGCHTNPPKR